MEENKVLALLPYYDGGKQGRELEMSLTGWKKFCQFPVEIAIIGDYNPIIENFDFVTYIPCERVKDNPKMYRPHLDIVNKIIKGYEYYKGRYKGFFWVTDDEYPISVFTYEYLNKPYYLREDFTGNLGLTPNYWQHDQGKTRELLRKENLGHVNYTIHFPQYFDFEKLMFIFDKYDMRNTSYVIENLYYNYYDTPKVKQADEIRLGVWNQETVINKLDDAFKNNTKFLACSTKGYSKLFEKKLCKHLGLN